MDKLDLNALAEGAFREKVSEGMQQVWDNIHDPNTDYRKKRKLTIELTFDTTEERDMAMVNIVVKPKLIPPMPVGTKFLIGSDGEGDIIASECIKQIPGQTHMRVDESTGEILEETKEDKKDSVDLTGIKLVK